jgi:polysaccharide export outer membrane protein
MRQRSVRWLGLTVVLATMMVSGQSLADPATAPARPVSSAAAAHRMEPGDVLEINVVGMSDLKQRVVVGLDGDVQLHLAGPVSAAGLTLQELRGQICTALSRKVLKQRTLDGRDTVQTIEPDDVTVTIAEYRPIYISGDVARPGEIPFRPGILVSQAITLAGGYDIMRFRLSNPFLDTADMKSDYDTLWMDLVREQSRIARLEAELKGQADLGSFDVRGTPLRPAAVQQIIRLETDQMKVRNADYQKERDFFERAIVQSDHNLAVLTEQQKNEKEGADLDASDYERIRELFQRGAVPITRLTDARRSMLLSSTRALQTQNQIEQVKKEREDARRNLQRTSDKRQMDLTQDLQNSVSKIAALRNKLEAVGDKLVYTGLVKSQLVRGKGAEPDLKISRRSATGRVRRPARDDTELLPGDVLEVSLEAELVPPLPPQTNFSNDKPTSQADQPAGNVEQRDGARGATVAANEPAGRSPVRAPPGKPPSERGVSAGAAR